jgi:hypothetical protein
MTEVRKLTFDGIGLFERWLEDPNSAFPPSDLLSGDEYSEVLEGLEIDPGRKFASRYEFGEYLNEVLPPSDFKSLMGRANDGLWAWLAVLYFEQLSEKGIRRGEHYIPQRSGLRGSLTYRHAARTSYELVHIHGENAQVCLSVPMHTYGDMTEQLASRQTLAHNRGFFTVAARLYLRNGKLIRGASSRAKPPKKRKAGDRTGFGAGDRLALALKRLDLTFDTQIMDSDGLVAVLPKEFSKWTNVSAS